MILARFRTQPEEKRKFVVDYSERLQEGEVLVSLFAIKVEPADADMLNVSGGIHPDGDKVVLYTTGGKSLMDYKVTLQVETSDNNVVWEDELQFMVEDI